MSSNPQPDPPSSKPEPAVGSMRYATTYGDSATAGQSRAGQVGGKRTGLAVCIALLLGSLGVNWFSLTGPSTFTVRPVHLLIIAVTACVALCRPDLTQLYRALSRTRFTLYAGFMLALIALKTLSVAMVSGAEDGLPYLLKEIIYFGMGVAMLVGFYTLIRSGSRGELSLRRGALLGIGLFFGTVILLFASRGENVIFSYLRDIARADAYRLQFYYYKTIFGAFVDEKTSTALRNSIVGAFVLYFIVLWATRPAVRRTWPLATAMGAAACVFVVLTSVSRSNILALAMASAVPLALSSVHNARQLRVLLVVAAMGLASALAVTTLVDLSDNPVFKLVEERFGDGIQHDPRQKMFREAVLQSAEKPFWGHGLGAELHYPGARNTERIHNFILASLYELGVGGLVLSLLTFAALLFAWWQACQRIVLDSQTWRLAVSPFWVMSLPALPALRCLVSGNGGQLTIIEWACLALFFALVAANESATASETASQPDDRAAQAPTNPQRPASL